MENRGYAQLVIKTNKMKYLLLLLILLQCNKSSIVKTNNPIYERDKKLILKNIKVLVNHHIGFFVSKEYNDSTQIIIDTVVYSPDFKKFATLIITKNSTSQQLMPNSEEWYYNATCFLGTKKNDTLSLYWYGPNFTNSNNPSYLSETIRKKCFEDLQNSKEERYNINDNRFWDSKVWKQKELQDSLQIFLNEEKKNHPENVFEPALRSLQLRSR